MAPAGNRIALIDGLRGYFLVLMMSSHLAFQGGAWALKLHHSQFAFVEDAQGFVFLSGLVVGLTYARILAKRGPDVLWDKASARVGELYRMVLLTLAVVMTMLFLVPDAARIWGWQLGKLAQSPADNLGAAAAMLYQPAYLDILPQYMIYLLAAPFIVRATASGHGLRVMAISGAIWFMAQIGLQMPLVEAAEAGLASVVPGGTLRAFFNPMAWQLLFVSGLVLGAAAASGRLSADAILGPKHRDLALIALGVVALFAGLRIVHGEGALDGALGERFYKLLRREDLSLSYVVNFAALGYGVAWILHNAQEATTPRAVALLGRGLRRFFALPFLVFLGRHSLQVYAFHVIVAYGVGAIDWHFGPFDEPSKTAIIIAAVASLGIPAAWHAANQRRDLAARQVKVA
ncbi:hypothetical protein D3874_08485 [Oleomonas cavernae]|uniref:DUF1624 domain-containing protein n=1 Tax=Oleomonas cavernae TaxID=2320859 RepID=A0A418WAS4_9PROT|nr:OpgC domain-containing protein [Oleomonas cavernae]RJF87056.1 hypothetical protein D3874_08485 [Oleomonas cavernae]